MSLRVDASLTCEMILSPQGSRCSAGAVVTLEIVEECRVRWRWGVCWRTGVFALFVSVSRGQVGREGGDVAAAVGDSWTVPWRV